MKTIFQITTLILFLVCIQVSYSQSNETVVYSFKTENKQEVVLAMDKNNNYIVYRFNVNNEVKFEYPDKTKESWKKFKYSYYLRGGGAANEGMDLNYIAFSNDSLQYVIYDTYYSVGNETKIGVKITDLTTNKTADIKGDPKTRKGSLIGFRDNNLLEISEEIFD